MQFTSFKVILAAIWFLPLIAAAPVPEEAAALGAAPCDRSVELLVEASVSEVNGVLQTDRLTLRCGIHQKKSTHERMSKYDVKRLKQHPKRRALFSQLTMTSSAPASATEFQGVFNFRDVALSTSDSSDTTSHPLISVGRLFRSGKLDDATEKDIQRLRDTYGIRTIVDLRSETEGKHPLGLKKTYPSAKTSPQPPRHKGVLLPPPQDSKQSECHSYYVNFTGKKFRSKAAWGPLPLKYKLKVIGLVLIGQKRKAPKTIGRKVLQAKGLIGLYKAFVDYCQDEIGQTLRILCEESNYPILVHCTQGKDRTGLIIALALSICDVPRPRIISDFAITQSALQPHRQDMIQEMAQNGLDESFVDAPPEVLEETLAYIDSNYGSVKDYLTNNVQFDQEMQTRLQQCLIVRA
ncbi:protein-tyrosine phosphatase-like protein [Flagelloscypha sp. PMI_526]|nr:protein-tyrosine phosphatase-like protein [Flagelloscypha sp. PMI_526]